MSSKLCIKLVKSTICVPKKHRLIVAGLGLRRINQVVELEDSSQIRGMISKISHMLSVV